MREALTGEEHSKRVGLLHLVYGGLFTLISLVVVLFSGLFSGFLRVVGGATQTPDFNLFWALAGVVLVFQLLQAVPALLSGYGMLKGKPWARTAALVTSVLSALVFPFGTGLSVYTLWFLFGEKGREYQRGLAESDWRGYLREADTDSVLEATADEREHAYRPPQQPPDWRGEEETPRRREI